MIVNFDCEPQVLPRDVLCNMFGAGDDDDLEFNPAAGCVSVFI